MNKILLITICLLTFISCDKKKSKDTSPLDRAQEYYTFSEHPIKSNSNTIEWEGNKLEKIPFNINVDLDKSKDDKIEWKLYIKSKNKDSIILNGNLLKNKDGVLITEKNNILNYYPLEKGNYKIQIIMRSSSHIEYTLDRNIKVQ